MDTIPTQTNSHFREKGETVYNDKKLHKNIAEDQRPPDGPRSSTPIIFKKGSIILFLRSSDARRSFSFAGTGTAAEINTRAKIPARAASTACRRAVALAALLDAKSDSNERALRRKLPPEMNAAAEAGVGAVGDVVSEEESGSCEVDESMDLSAEPFCFLVFEVEGLDFVVDGTGATSFAIRASMNVTKVKETLCAGE